MSQPHSAQSAPTPASPHSSPPLLESALDRLRYSITRADIVRGSLRAILYNRALGWYMAVLFTFLSMLTFRDYLAKGTPVGVIAVALVIQLLLVCAIVAAGISLVALLSLHLNKGRGLVGEHELVMTAEGLIERTDVNESLHKWRGLGEVRETGRYFFIRTMEGGGAFHIVPKSRQIIEGDPRMFIARLRERKARITSEPAAPATGRANG